MSEIQQPQPLGLEPSFGFGDRLGSATPGHVAAMRRHGRGILPIFAQQSIREMTRTHRTALDVMSAAVTALKEEDYTDRWGADADHLKTERDVDVTAAAGFVFFTIDPSDHVDIHADDDDNASLDRKFREIGGNVPWVSEYAGRRVQIEGCPEIELNDAVLRRAAVKYGRAIAHAIKLGRYIDQVMQRRGGGYEIELSVDETPHPTSLAEHYLIADLCLRSGMKLVSLAPRYVGDFEKGIDYKGDLQEFARSLGHHAAIARQLGPYKLSLHSGSDKLSIYETFARVTQGRFHVKTAGTSYLEALRVVARHDGKLLRAIIDFSRGRFEGDRATYHISAELNRVPPPAEIADDGRLERLYLDEDDGRQILHVTFGSVLTDPALGAGIRSVLRAEPATHREVLVKHFGRHLEALRRGL